MATLENIRKRGALLAVVIGVALLAFILGDAFRTGDRLFSGSRFDIAEIAGKSYTYQEYADKVEKLANIAKMQSGGQNIDNAMYERIRNQVWNELVRETILSDEYSELGIDVTPDELFDLVQGSNVDPMIQQNFRNPETKQFDRAMLMNFLKNYEKDPKYKAWWLYIESNLVNRRKYNKYTKLIEKGLYITDTEAKMEVANRKQSVSGKVIGKKFSDVPDADIQVTDADLQAFYDKHKDEYEQEESRDISYVSFAVKPSEQDRKDAEEWIYEIKPEFEATDNNEQFLRLNDPENTVDRKYYKEKEVPQRLKSFLFTAEPGEVYGPYFEDGTYKIVKLTEKTELPDSVNARHILIQPEQRSAEAAQKAQATADSIYQLIKDGGDFAALAKEFSADKSNADKGGELDWFQAGRMVREFNDSCFFGKTGDIKLVNTQFGVHIVEILDKGIDTTKVQYVTLNKKVEASNATRNDTYNKALKFASLNNTSAKFETGIEKIGLQKRTANNIKPLQKSFAEFTDARGFIRAVYKTELNQLITDDKKNPVFEIGDNFLIGKVITVKEKGITPFEQKKDQIRIEVMREKKAETLIKQFEGYISQAGSIEEIASKAGVVVNEAENINFNSQQITGIGMEPAVVGALVALPENKISEPIKGNNGIYIAVVSKRNEVGEIGAFATEKKSLNRTLSGRVMRDQAYNALKEETEIEDMRAKFY